MNLEYAMVALLVVMAIAIAVLATVVVLQRLIVLEQQELMVLWRARHDKVSEEARARAKVENDRYELMWKVRMLNEEQIAFLKQANYQLGEFIRKQNWQPPDDADWWKRDQ